MTGPGDCPNGRNCCRTVFMVTLFASAMGYLEAAVVVYLRGLYYPEGFAFPLRLMEHQLLLVELGRETATLIMLVTLAWLSGRKLAGRLAFFMLAFAVWDIFYYIWLKLLIGWPESWLTWDILFLLPLPWIGPVLSPLIVSLAMLTGSWFILRRLQGAGQFRPVMREWFFALSGAGLIFLSYVIDTDAGLRGGMPAPYRWELLAGGLALGYYALFRCLRRTCHV
jgi:hypothetical protein